jgi:two-component system response regulator MprA
MVSEVCASSGRTILVVDDDVAIRSTLADCLVLEGYDVVEAADGVEALQIVHEMPNPPLLVLLDLMMPRMTGEELLEVLRTEGRIPELPVVVLTATSPSHDRVAGARVCLHKPISYESLMRIVTALGPLPEPHSQTGT